LRDLALPVGGIKEKVLAATRAGIKTMMLPARNQKDLEDFLNPRAINFNLSGLARRAGAGNRAVELVEDQTTAPVPTAGVWLRRSRFLNRL
jgi:ATP-dependent Lon protease